MATAQKAKVKAKVKDEVNVRKLQKQANGSTTVTLPAELLREMKWKEGMKLVFKKRGEALLLEVYKKAPTAKKEGK